MARKKLEEPERWITVNGQHLPVYPGGVIGQPGQTPPAEEKKTSSSSKESVEKKINALYNDVKDLPKKLPEGHEYAIYNKTRGEFEGKGTYSSKNPENVVTREGTTSYGFRGSNTVAKEFERRKQINPDDEYQIVAIKKGPARSEAENAKIREEAAHQRQYAEANAAEKKNQTSPKTAHSTVADTVQQNVDALNDFHDKAWKYGADRDALKTLIRQRANEMPDGTVLARVNQETSSQYTSKGIMQQTETKMSKLYKINGQWSRYKDGSGKIDDIASEVIHGSGKLQTLESAKQEAAKLQETDEIKTRGYGTKERFTSTKDNDKSSAITPDSIKAAGGSADIGDYHIEIGKLYNSKTGNYDGGFGKKTAVSTEKGGHRETKYFNSPEKAIEFAQKSSTSKPATTSRNARYDTSRANNMSLVSKSSSALKTMYRNASPEEKKIIAAELASRGFYRKNDKWTSMGGGR